MPIEMVWMAAGAGILWIAILVIGMVKTWNTHRAIQRLQWAEGVWTENITLRGYLMDIVEKFPEGLPTESEFEACPWCQGHYLYKEVGSTDWRVSDHNANCPFMGAVKFLNVPGYEEAPIG